MVNVCPAALTSTSPDRVWSVLDTPERFTEWSGARFVSADPPGVVRPGQVINLVARGFGREWPVTIDVRDVDPAHRRLDVIVHLPLGIANHESVMLTATKEGGTLVRFN